MHAVDGARACIYIWSCVGSLAWTRARATNAINEVRVRSCSYAPLGKWCYLKCLVSAFCASCVWLWGLSAQTPNGHWGLESQGCGRHFVLPPILPVLDRPRLLVLNASSTSFILLRCARYAEYGASLPVGAIPKQLLLLAREGLLALAPTSLLCSRGRDVMCDVLA